MHCCPALPALLVVSWTGLHCWPVWQMMDDGLALLPPSPSTAAGRRMHCRYALQALLAAGGTGASLHCTPAYWSQARTAVVLCQPCCLLSGPCSPLWSPCCLSAQASFLYLQGWRLDPILLFGQLLVVGAAVTFAVEAIRLRSIVYGKVGATAGLAVPALSGQQQLLSASAGSCCRRPRRRLRCFLRPRAPQGSLKATRCHQQSGGSPHHGSSPQAGGHR